MKLLPKPIVFDWDEGNINKNLNHDVSDKESEEIFANKPIFIQEDERHSLIEVRYLVWSVTNKGRKLSVFFTIRKNKIRIISARDMHKKERRAYEEKIQNNS